MKWMHQVKVFTILCMSFWSAQGFAATYAETVEECKLLFIPLAPVKQLEKLFKTELVVTASGNSEHCALKFSGKNEGEDNLATIAFNHRGISIRKYDAIEKDAKALVSKTYAPLDLKDVPDAVRGYTYIAFRRNYIDLQNKNQDRIILSVAPEYSAVLYDVAMQAIEVINNPALDEWLKR